MLRDKSEGFATVPKGKTSHFSNMAGGHSRGLSMEK
jgi:hypothetical protein